MILSAYDYGLLLVFNELKINYIKIGSTLLTLIQRYSNEF